jgi:hypothetical protein
MSSRIGKLESVSIVFWHRCTQVTESSIERTCQRQKAATESLVSVNVPVVFKRGTRYPKVLAQSKISPRVRPATMHHIVRALKGAAGFYCPAGRRTPRSSKPNGHVTRYRQPGAT